MISIVSLALMALALQAPQSGSRTPPRPAAELARLGPQVGDTVPDFTLPDQTGRPRTLGSVLGPKGGMIVFTRSADWWPYCRTQLVELQGRVAELRRQGLGLATISYDRPATLKAFADKHGITFPMLADVGSATIKRYGILNTQVSPDDKEFYGIPYPGTFVIDRNRRVTARFFEESYQNRNTAASLALKLGETAPAGGPPLATDHLALQTFVSDEDVAPGTRFSLGLSVTPNPAMHVYAPPQAQYRAVKLTLEPNPAFIVHPMVFPAGEEYYFAPLDERVKVYSKPFRLLQDLTVAITPDVRARAKEPGATLTITGTLEYQACDDKMCFLPVTVPVSWTVRLKPLEP